MIQITVSHVLFTDKVISSLYIKCFQKYLTDAINFF